VIVGDTSPWPWVGLLLLGAWHGINPGMGWLFAVALGLQEQDARAVWRALPPLALGHALAVGTAILLAMVIGRVIPIHALKWLVAAVLLGFGLLRLLRSRHPRFGGMQVGARDLTIWSFLMASAHGAGLMVLPLFLGVTHTGPYHGVAPSEAGHAVHVAAVFGVMGNQTTAVLATLLHAAGYLLVMGLVAILVYKWLGLRWLGKMWLNLDLVWAAALILTGMLTLVV
jgi:hypothetical protein